MAYDLWYSEKMADQLAGEEQRQGWKHQGYLIAVDQEGGLVQFTAATEERHPGFQREHGAYIVASFKERYDVRILVSAEGKVNEALAQDLDIAPDLNVIKSLTPKFYEPKSAVPKNNAPQVKDKHKLSF